MAKLHQKYICVVGFLQLAVAIPRDGVGLEMTVKFLAKQSHVGNIAMIRSVPLVAICN